MCSGQIKKVNNISSRSYCGVAGSAVELGEVVASCATVVGGIGRVVGGIVVAVGGVASIAVNAGEGVAFDATVGGELAVVEELTATFVGVVGEGFVAILNLYPSMYNDAAGTRGSSLAPTARYSLFSVSWEMNELNGEAAIMFRTLITHGSTAPDPFEAASAPLKFTLRR